MLTQTTTQLLDSLRDSANAESWQLFDLRYRPVLLAFARQRGLSDEDAADVAQTTLVSFVADYQKGRYDRTRGRLSSWIIGIASHRIADLQRAAYRQRISRGESAIEHEPAPADEAAVWEAAVRKVILQRAMTELHSQSRFDPRTLRAFELCAVRGVPADAAAAECGMTVAEVYVAKNRVIGKLREIVASLTSEFVEL